MLTTAAAQRTSSLAEFKHRNRLDLMIGCARVLGAPAWDPDFGVADLPMMMVLGELPAAYRRRFMGH